MKRIFLLWLAVVTLIGGCKKDSEQPALHLKFSVEAPTEDFSDKGINEEVAIPLKVVTDFDFSKVPLKYKIETDKQAIFKIGDKEVLSGDIQKLETPEITLFYTGKQQGEHTIKVTVINSPENKSVKELKLNYKEYGYTLETVNAKASASQGENVDFSLKITPVEGAPKMDYFITFKSFDIENDPKLEKNLVAMNGEKVELGKEYKIENLADIKIRINSFYSGKKELKYIIKNKTFEREEVFTQEVSKNNITFSEGAQLSKTVARAINETISFVGKIIKEPIHSNKVWYKTEITEGQADGLTTTADWVETTLTKENVVNNLSFIAKKEGEYKYKITFKDEFDNEVSKIFDVSLKINKDFTIELSEGKQNPYQGEAVTFKLKVIPQEHAPQMDYFIIFKSFSEEDPQLQKDFVAFNGQKIVFDKEYKITNLADSKIRINSFFVGNKELNYIIKNKYVEKNNTIVQNVQRSGVVLSEGAQLSKNAFRNINETIKFVGKITKKPHHNNKIWYKTEITEGQIDGLTTTSWREIQLGQDNSVNDVTIKPIKEGKYKYKITFKDEFGSETNKVFDVEFKVNRTFVTEITGGKLNANQGEAVDFKLKVIPAEHAPQMTYYIIFKSFGNDINLNRDYVAFNGQKIAFDQEYKIENLADSRIRISSFYAGNKELKYIITNRHTQKEGSILQNVQTGGLVLSESAQLSKDVSNTLNETIKFVGKVTKKTNYNNKIWYKTEIVSGAADGLTTTEWRETSLGINNFVNDITFRTLKEGKYRYRVFFRDEFGNETNKTFDFEVKINRGFSTEISGGKQSPYQGEVVDFKLKVTPDNGAPQMDYFITFKSFGNDNNLEKDYVAFNGQKIIFDKEYKIDNLLDSKIRINSFYIGNKKLKYIITNKNVQKEGEITQNVNKNTLTVSESAQLSKNVSNTLNETIKFLGKVTKNPNHNNKIWYKTEIVSGTADGLTTTEWRETSLGIDNSVNDVTFKTLKEGKYRYRILFKDEFANETNKTFDFEVKINRGFSTEITGGKQSPYQGEVVDFKLKVTPDNGAPQMDYFITFKSFGNDNNLEKDYVAFNGQKIIFDKEYKIDNLSDSRIRISSFYSGNKELKYITTNRHTQKEGAVIQNVQKNNITISENTQLSKNISNTFNETIKFIGKIIKNPNHNNKVWYKTEIVSGAADGLTTTNWRETSLGIDNSVNDVTFKTLKEGKYRYRVLFKDEFGNETNKTFDFEVKINRGFSTEIIGGKKNPYQGEAVDFKLKVIPDNGAPQMNYFITFKSFGNDNNLEKDYVAFNGQKIIFDKEYRIINPLDSRIRISSFYSGRKELKYIITNRHVQKEGAVIQNVQKNNITISENAQLNKYISNTLNETIKFIGKIIKNPNHNNKIWYKTEIVSGAADGLTTTEWRETSLGVDNSINDITFRTLKEGKYRYRVLFKDEFGNETNKTFDFEVKINRGFSTEIIGGKKNPYQGEAVDFKLKVIPDNGAPQMNYFITFKSFGENDPQLQKDYVAFNGQKIVFDKEYRIDNLADSKIRINSFYTGNKILKYIITNKNIQKEETILQNVQKNSISYELNFNKTETNYLNENLNLRGLVTKSPKYNNKIWYRTWANSSGIETTNKIYREYNLLGDNSFSINVNTKLVGNHRYYIQFKDEFENESYPQEFYINVNNKNFVINQIVPDLSNIYQGQNVTIDFSIQGEYNGRYKIKFVSFDEQDVNLNKSKIIFNEKEMKLHQIEDALKSNNRLVISSFNKGIKKLVYEIYEVSNQANKVRKEVIVNFKQAPILVDVRLNSSRITEGDKFLISGNITHRSNTKNIKYRTKALKNNSITNDITTTNNNWTNITLNRSNGFQLELNSINNGTYAYYIQFLDEFGNESEYKNIPLNIHPKLEIKEFSVNCTIKASIKKEQPTSDNYEFTVSNVSNSKVKIQSGANNKIQKIKIEMPTIEGEFKKEYTFTNVRDIENVFSETHFFFKEDCSEDRYSIDLGTIMDCRDAIFDVTKKYKRSNVNKWTSTRRKAKITVYDSMGNNISKETYVNFTLDIKGKTESGITYDE